MVGVGKCCLCDLPCLSPLDSVLVDKKPHELGDTDYRVSVVELDGVVLREIVQIIAVVLLVTVDDVLQGCGNEEVLLSYTEYLSVVGSVVGVEDSPDVLYTVPLDDGVVETL